MNTYSVMDINNESRRYIIQSIVLFCLLTILGGLAMSLWSLDLLRALVVSGCFILAIDLTSGLIFRWVATRHADMLSSFFTGVSGFRFLGALAVMAIWYTTSERSSMMLFIVVFLIYYMASLIHHSIFFSRISNRL
jgi:F0F1-type ATP synthase assembly protein I